MNVQLWQVCFRGVAAALVLASAFSSNAQLTPPSAVPPKTIDAATMKATLEARVDPVAREQSAPPQVRAVLADLRRQIAQEKKSFKVGYNPAMDVPLSLLAATRIPRTLPDTPSAFRVADRLTDIDKRRFADFLKLNPNLVSVLANVCSPSGKQWDWRKVKKVTNIKSQICGTCWDFTSVGTFESSYAIRNASLIDGSEQYILNCGKAGDCTGGWWMPAFDYMVSSGFAKESDDPFTGNDTSSCPTGTATPYRATAWDFVDRPRWDKVPTTNAMKKALCEHGPVAVAVEATPAFQAYVGGIFDESQQNFPWINHGVIVIGWNDARSAWLIKNSSGPGWGETGGYGTEKGYMWIKYGSNNIGIAAAWVDAARAFYALPSDWNRVLDSARVVVKPIPRPDPPPFKFKPLPAS